MTSLHDLTSEQKVSVVQAGLGYTRNEAVAFLADMAEGVPNSQSKCSPRSASWGRPGV